MGLDAKLKEEIIALVKESQSPDSIELGDSKGRVKVYVNFSKEEEAKKKISIALKVLNEKKKEVL